MSKTHARRAGNTGTKHKVSKLTTSMRNFLFLICGAVVLWLLFLTTWTTNYNDENRSQPKEGMQPTQPPAAPQKAKPIARNGDDQQKTHASNAKTADWWLNAASSSERSSPNKLYLVTTMKNSSKYLRQLRLLLGSARIEITLVGGDIHSIVLQIIDIMSSVSRGEQLLLIFTNITVYYKILCRSPEFFRNRFGEVVSVLVLSSHADEDQASDQGKCPLPLTVDFSSNATVVRFVAHQKDSEMFRILHTGKPFSLYDRSPMRLTTFSHYNRTLWEPVLCIGHESALCDKALLLIRRNDAAENSMQRMHVALLAINLDYWWSQITFFELIGYFSPKHNQLSLERYILVDIDDAFIGREGTKMTPDDVAALLVEQNNIAQNYVRNFRFNIGFSAHARFFHHGSAQEVQGDDALVENREKFWWFPHMYDHMQPHLFNVSADLESRMLKNLQFAHSHSIELESGYAVSPHHSGVYPIHAPLYDAWKRVYNISVTSTEQYPHLKPFGLHRGFQYRNVSVLPRQVCGLYTKTLHFTDYPGGGGLAALNRSIFGGGGTLDGDESSIPTGSTEIFSTLLTKPISIFMTHMLNYASHDRVALYTFREALKFITERTTLKFQTVPPAELARLYFNDFYPQDKNPVWSNPCDDVRHREIWARTSSSNKSLDANSVCENLPLPDAVIVGPQKTGTTALYTFLKLHPAVKSSLANLHEAPFEEVQFFSSNKRYVEQGLEWYLKQFPSAEKKSPMLFEKSATYFDSELTPLRMHALLPQAKLVVILADPVKRAYSWYLHAKAHGDAAATLYSFYDFIKPTIQQQTDAEVGENSAVNDTRSLRRRCVEPGKYAVHLKRWLKYYTQILIIDADELQTKPVQVMNNVQRFLKLEPVVDYSTLIRFVPKKHFYCPIVQEQNTGASSRVKCLGSGKGRSINSVPIDSKAEFGLRNFYRQHNLELYHLLKGTMKEGNNFFKIPRWLTASVGDGDVDDVYDAMLVVNNRRRGLNIPPV